MTAQPLSTRGQQATMLAADYAPQPSIDALLALTAPGMDRVNAVILDRMQSEIPLIPELANHLISSGGKRLRPMLTVASAGLLDYAGDAQYALAAAVEFIHTATLLHDDVVDGSDMRRGKAAANIIFGNPATVLVGDYLFSRSFELMVEAGSLRVLEILARASAIIAEGEVDQLTAQRKVETSEEHYLQIIEAKTAALFAAACRISAVAAGRSAAEEQALDDYGRYLGVAFQLVDDAIDYDSESQEMGKGKGDDFRDGKMTLPVILAYAAGTPEEQQFWRDAIAGFRTEDEDLAEAVAIIARHGTVEATRQRAADYAQKAMDALSIFPDSPMRRAMQEAALFSVARRY
ncbi:polyprenyl synthetase family protein [Novosphingobium umbonatum]|uniref:Octaprenyl diphosphate synthase n=2 Tax=Novosphingobium umbonatum TaxID=1908524 RepID=A0A437MXF9_9SPHN|nr:polyprenyl synthetase family protein [Novosphingobium umbonatum]